MSLDEQFFESSIDDMLFADMLNGLTSAREHGETYTLPTDNDGRLLPATAIEYQPLPEYKEQENAIPLFTKEAVDKALFYTDNLGVFGEKNKVAHALREMGIQTLGGALKKDWTKIDGIEQSDIQVTAMWLRLRASKLPPFQCIDVRNTIPLMCMCRVTGLCWDPLGRLRKIQIIDKDYDAFCRAIALYVKGHQTTGSRRRIPTVAEYNSSFSKTVRFEAREVLRSYRQSIPRSIPEPTFMLWALPILEAEAVRTNISVATRYLENVLNANMPSEEVPLASRRIKRLTKEQANIILAEVATIQEPTGVPFPQANSLDKVIELCRSLDMHDMTLDEIANRFSFTTRQASYYANAGVYLGLTKKVTYPNRGIELDTLGKLYLSCNAEESNAFLARVVLRHKPFKETFRLLAQSGSMPDKDRIADLIDTYTNCTGSTPKRRASTVAAWIEWIWNHA